MFGQCPILTIHRRAPASLTHMGETPQSLKDDLEKKMQRVGGEGDPTNWERRDATSWEGDASATSWGRDFQRVASTHYVIFTHSHHIDAPAGRNTITPELQRRLTGCTAEYVCNPGYKEGNGDKIKTCTMGQWDAGPALVCSIAYCTAPQVTFQPAFIVTKPDKDGDCPPEKLNSVVYGECNGYELECSNIRISQDCKVSMPCIPGFRPKLNAVFEGLCDVHTAPSPCCGIDHACLPQPCDRQVDIEFAWAIGTETDCFSYLQCGYPQFNELQKTECENSANWASLSPVPTTMNYFHFQMNCLSTCGVGFVSGQMTYKCTVLQGNTYAETAGANPMACTGRSCTGGVPRNEIPGTGRKTGIEAVIDAQGGECVSATTQQVCRLKCKLGYLLKKPGGVPSLTMSGASTGGTTVTLTDADWFGTSESGSSPYDGIEYMCHGRTQLLIPRRCFYFGAKSKAGAVVQEQQTRDDFMGSQ